MAGDFSASISLFREATEQRIDFACTKIARELFNEIIEKTPVGESPTRGTLVNNWQAGVGVFNTQFQSRPGPDKQGAKRRMELIITKGSFLGKDNFVTLCNSTEYAWRAEFGGWEPPRWKGTPPYAMVRLSLAEIASKYGV